MDRRDLTVSRSIPRVLLVLLLAASALWVAVNRQQINAAALNAWIDQLGSWSLVGYVAVYAVATIPLSPPPCVDVLEAWEKSGISRSAA